MKKFLFLFLLNSSLLFAQTNNLKDYVSYDESGTMFYSDTFYELYHADKLILNDDDKKLIYATIQNDETLLQLKTTKVFNKIEIYSRLEFSYELLKDEERKFEIQKRKYNLFNKVENKQFKRLRSGRYGELIFNLLKKYNSNKKYNEALLLIENDILLFETHRNFTCGKGGIHFYTTKGTTFFNTYVGAKKEGKALNIAFKYLLENKDYANKIIQLLESKYDVNELNSAYFNLFENYKEDNRSCRFLFLDYVIEMNDNTNDFKPCKTKKEAVSKIKQWAFYKALQSKFE